MPQLDIDPEMLPLAGIANDPSAPSIRTVGPEAMRAILAQMSPAGGADMWKVEDVELGGVLARCYLPSESPIATILLYHGGGWTVGSVRDYDFFARSLASDTGCRVVSVEYRLAPENPFPAAVDDAWAALTALDSEGALFVAGDSAGGNLSAVMAQRARDEGLHLSGQILIYPSVDGDIDAPSMHAFDPPMMPRADIQAFFDFYVPDRSARRDPRFAPINGNLEGVAPALVITATADLLAADAERYFQALLDAGVDATLHRQVGALHAYLTLLPQSAAAVSTMRVIADFVLDLVGRDLPAHGHDGAAAANLA